MLAYFDVALPVPLSQIFTYVVQIAATSCWHARQSPFGSRQLVGIVIGRCKQPCSHVKVKSIQTILDSTPTFSDDALALAQFIAQYYFHPLGQVLQQMMPAVLRKGIRFLCLYCATGNVRI